VPTIRPAREQDLPAVLDIYNHAIEHTTAVFASDPHTLDMRKAWLREKQDAGFPVLVASDGDHVTGFATYGQFRAWPGYKYTVEHSVYVGVEARRRGIGRALVEAVVTDARRQGMHAIVAGIGSDNDVSIRMHARLGFVEAGHLREVGFKFGRWLDLTFMQLLL
jgi:L-amino acid N-acyltransferase YncA